MRRETRTSCSSVLSYVTVISDAAAAQRSEDDDKGGDEEHEDGPETTQSPADTARMLPRDDEICHALDIICRVRPLSPVASNVQVCPLGDHKWSLKGTNGDVRRYKCQCNEFHREKLENGRWVEV